MQVSILLNHSVDVSSVILTKSVRFVLSQNIVFTAELKRNITRPHLDHQTQDRVEALVVTFSHSSC